MKIRVECMIDGDLACRLEALKKDLYADKSFSKMYRDLFAIGVAAIEKKTGRSYGQKEINK